MEVDQFPLWFGLAVCYLLGTCHLCNVCLAPNVLFDYCDVLSLHNWRLLIGGSIFQLLMVRLCYTEKGLIYCNMTDVDGDHLKEQHEFGGIHLIVMFQYFSPD